MKYFHSYRRTRDNFDSTSTRSEHELQRSHRTSSRRDPRGPSHRLSLMDETDRQRLAFVALSLSCLTGAYLIAQLQMRVRRLEKVMIRVHAYIEADFQETIDEKFEEIVEDLRDE